MAVLAAKSGALVGGRATGLANRHALLLAVISHTHTAVATNGASVRLLGVLFPREHASQPAGARVGATNTGAEGKTTQTVDQQVVVTLHAKRGTRLRRGEGRGVGSSSGRALILQAGTVGLQRGGEASGGGHGRRSVRSQVGEGLGSPQVLAIGKVARRVHHAQKARVLSTQGVEGPRSLLASLAEVDGCRPVKATTTTVRLARGGNRGRRGADIGTCGDLEDLDLALFAAAT